MHAMNALCNLKILRLGNILKTENIAFRHIKWRIMKVTESEILAQGEGKEKKVILCSKPEFLKKYKGTRFVTSAFKFFEAKCGNLIKYIWPTSSKGG